MALSAVLVSTTPERLAEVATAIASEPWAEVHHKDALGRLIAVVDSPGTDEAAERLKALKSLPGVLAAEMVLHAYEEDLAAEVELTPERAATYLNDPDTATSHNHFRRLKGIGNS